SAVTNGTTSITATAGLLSGSATVTVSQVPVGIILDPATANLVSLGATQQITATVSDANSNVITGPNVTWTSSNPLVAGVTASGLVTAIDNGSATVTASISDVSAVAAVNVAQVVSAVSVAPSSSTLGTVGETVQLSATASDANGSAIAGKTATWTSSDDAVATVSVSGLVTAGSEGSATITATVDGVTGTAVITVDLSVASVSVTPTSTELTALGDQVQLSAAALDASGDPVGDASFTWSSSDDAIATVDQSGLVTGVSNGTATITATTGSVSGSATVTVAKQIEVQFGPSGTINLGSNGNTPVTIFNTSVADGDSFDFDVTQVDTLTILFAGVSPLRASFQDKDGDGDDDLVVHFDTQLLQLSESDTTATITGRTLAGVLFHGVAPVNIVNNGNNAPPGVPPRN
ncbi:MAG: Ig domain-containing protein, partial [Gemmatimonadales bacterium]